MVECRIFRMVENGWKKTREDQKEWWKQSKVVEDDRRQLNGEVVWGSSQTVVVQEDWEGQIGGNWGN